MHADISERLDRDFAYLREAPPHRLLAGLEDWLKRLDQSPHTAPHVRDITREAMESVDRLTKDALDIAAPLEMTVGHTQTHAGDAGTEIRQHFTSMSTGGVLRLRLPNEKLGAEPLVSETLNHLIEKYVQRIVGDNKGNLVTELAEHRASLSEKFLALSTDIKGAELLPGFALLRLRYLVRLVTRVRGGTTGERIEEERLFSVPEDATNRAVVADLLANRTQSVGPGLTIDQIRDDVAAVHLAITLRLGAVTSALEAVRRFAHRAQGFDAARLRGVEVAAKEEGLSRELAIYLHDRGF